MEHTATLKTAQDLTQALQQARLARGKSQTELAEEVGVAQSMISEIENGSGTIYLRRLLEMAEATGLTLTASWSSKDSADS